MAVKEKGRGARGRSAAASGQYGLSVLVEVRRLQ